MVNWSNYECEGQLSIFDFIESENTEKTSQKTVADIEIREILKGSGFENGKKRIFDYFNENHTNEEYIQFLKKEYGVGGWSIDEGFCDHNSNGIDIKFIKPIGKTISLHIGWPMVVKRIKELIINGKYNPDESKICNISKHICNKKELWKVADTLDEIICPHMCCNICTEKLCGARCNGAEQLKEPLCSKAKECEAYPQGCGGTIEPCRFGGPFRWSNKSDKEDGVISNEVIDRI